MELAYVLPQEEGKPIMPVVPTSLQMRWVKSPPYFCAATETSHDISREYSETAVNLLPCHKFKKYLIGVTEYASCPESELNAQGFWYMIGVYVDNFMSLVIPVS